MVRVCVVGGGTAGSEAALEASARGAEVTVVERSERLRLPWGSWPDLIRVLGSCRRDLRPPRALGRDSSVKILTGEAKSAKRGLVATARGELRCDFTILATGSSFGHPGFLGCRKAGVVVLDSQGAYQELGRTVGSSVRAIVAGEGFRSLEVAERIQGDGKNVQVILSSWQHDPPSPLSLEVISGAASEAGVSVAAGPLERVLGATRLEGVVLNGCVIPCDSAVLVPRRVPRVLQTAARLGPRGGVLVDRSLRTSEQASFAAGGCAELGGEPAPHVLDGDAPVSGRIAGANCLGGEVSMGLARPRELIFFGLRWTRAGVAGFRSRFRPSQARVIGRRWGDRSACEIVFERSSGRVLGVELVEPACKAPSAAASPGTSLKSLAYGLCSSDISMISETARLGLAWQTY